ncbi:unnamed protein product, partial [Amoebophrya sp. A25]|eukprot:GSA25T00017036001.1
MNPFLKDEEELRKASRFSRTSSAFSPREDEVIDFGFGDDDPLAGQDDDDVLLPSKSRAESFEQDGGNDNGSNDGNVGAGEDAAIGEDSFQPSGEQVEDPAAPVLGFEDRNTSPKNSDAAAPGRKHKTQREVSCSKDDKDTHDNYKVGKTASTSRAATP